MRFFPSLLFSNWQRRMCKFLKSNESDSVEQKIIKYERCMKIYGIGFAATFFVGIHTRTMNYSEWCITKEGLLWVYTLCSNLPWPFLYASAWPVAIPTTALLYTLDKIEKIINKNKL